MPHSSPRYAPLSTDCGGGAVHMHGGGMAGGGRWGPAAGGMARGRAAGDFAGMGFGSGTKFNGGYAAPGAIITTGGSGADLGCGGMGCAGGQAGCFGEVVQSHGELMHVGRGGGDWVTETTYKYVGHGAGDLAVVVTQKRNYTACVGLIAVIVLVGVAIALCPSPTPATTIVKFARVFPTPATSLPPPPRKKCMFWGDPHISTFDGARPSFYGDGEFWIVKHDEVQIQGRYMGTPFTLGLAATQKVVVGGPFLKGNTIEVEPVEHAYGGHILVNGQPVLLEFGTYQVGDVATIRYDGVGELPDRAASQWTSRIVHMDLPMGITFTVFRWGNYLDLKLEMTQVTGGQDGSCGNFNGDPADDTTTAILARGARVTDNDLLFSSRAVTAFTTEEAEMLRRHCPAEELVKGELACRKDLPQNAETVQVNACVFDFCFGMNEHALQTAKIYATAEDKKAANM
mmetsp:Transcript_135486/g.432395  ORF Transcript_135486/g.432395 Transcript_135486/m.432395 type:complete len:457 (-) Transcript_135486:445-1815(-)